MHGQWASGWSAREQTDHAAGFTGVSPGFLIATAWLLASGLPMQTGERHAVRLVEVSGPAFATRTVEQVWTLAEVVRYEAQAGPLSVERWDVDDIELGLRRPVHLAGDVLVAAPAVELTALHGPPSWNRWGSHR